MLGSFKDEVDGKIMTGFLRLRPTRYALFCMVMKKYKKNKGTEKNTVKRRHGHDDYNQALETHEVIQGHLTV